MTTVLAVDPGVLTGYAMWDDTSMQLGDYGEVPHMEFLDYVWELTETNHIDVIVVEDYIITARTLKLSRQNASLEQIGALRWMAKYAGSEYVIQPPASKAFSTDNKLKHIEWWRPSSGGHQNDAIRHLVVYLLDQKFLSPRAFVG